MRNGSLQTVVSVDRIPDDDADIRDWRARVSWPCEPTHRKCALIHHSRRPRNSSRYSRALHRIGKRHEAPMLVRHHALRHRLVWRSVPAAGRTPSRPDRVDLRGHVASPPKSVHSGAWAAASSLDWTSAAGSETIMRPENRFERRGNLYLGRGVRGKPPFLTPDHDTSQPSDEKSVVTQLCHATSSGSTEKRPTTRLRFSASIASRLSGPWRR